MLVAAVSLPTWWSDSVLLAWVAIVVAVAAAGFTFWQAFTAHRTRQSATERALIGWAHAEWLEPTIVSITSRGPDEARDVLAVLTVSGREMELSVPRLRKGESLRFTLPEDSRADQLWQDVTERAPRTGDLPEAIDDVTVFTYGLQLSWHSPLGRQDDTYLTGDIRRKVVHRQAPLEPQPWPEVKPEVPDWPS